MVPLLADLKTGRSIQLAHTLHPAVHRLDIAVHLSRDFRQPVVEKGVHVIRNQTDFKAHILAALRHLDQQAVSKVPCSDTGRLQLLDEFQSFLEIVKREVKTRKDAASQYKETRPELAEKEEAEIEILLKYLPAQLSDEEVVAIAREVIEQTGATGPGDLGKIMGPLMGRLQGRADGNRAREAIQAVFAE